jgi:hypothetical protein
MQPSRLRHAAEKRCPLLCSLSCFISGILRLRGGSRCIPSNQRGGPVLHSSIDSSSEILIRWEAALLAESDLLLMNISSEVDRLQRGRSSAAIQPLLSWRSITPCPISSFTSLSPCSSGEGDTQVKVRRVKKLSHFDLSCRHP